jgi:hypothetical protein
MTNFNDGATPETTLTVFINERPYQMYYDSRLELRFVGNPAVKRVTDEMMKPFYAWIQTREGGDDNTTQPFSTGSVGEMYDNGELTFEQYLDYYALIGFSLKFLKMLPAFEGISVEIPDSENPSFE